MGLLPKQDVDARAARIRFEGRELIDASNDELRQLWGTQMAMVFQDPMTSLNPVMKIGNQITESLLLPPRHHEGVRQRDRRSRCSQSVGIPEPERRLSQYPHELSGGMRQRVMIAIAIACGPKLLFADEPTTALDVTVQAQILDLLQEQQRERFMAMILVTHDLGVVAGRADEIAVMYAGQVVEKAPTRRRCSPRCATRTPRRCSARSRSSTRPEPHPADHDRRAARRTSSTRRRAAGSRPAARTCRTSARAEEPPLLDADTPGHEYRCWFPVGTPKAGRAQPSAARVEAEATRAPATDVRPSAMIGSV